MMTCCACLWLGLFPLLQFGTYSAITSDKWGIMLMLAVLTPAGILFARPENRRTAAPSSVRLPVIIALLLAGWILVSCLASPYTYREWVIGASSRREGLLTQLCYLGLFFMFASVRVRRRPVLFSAAAGTAVFFLVVMLQRAGINVFGLYPGGLSYARAREFQGTIGNIDMDTGYLCLMAALFLTEITYALPRVPAFRGKARLLPLGYLLFLCLALGLAVFLIVTMDVQFGLLTLLALGVITLLRFVPPRLRHPLLAILLVLALILVWFWPGEAGGAWELKEILHGRAQLSFGSNRLGVWLFSLQLAPHQWIAGSGPDTFVKSFNGFLAENGLSLPDRQGNIPLQAFFDNPHNEYIAHLINHGLPAMLLFIALILSAVFFRRRRSGSHIKKAALREDRFRALSPWAAAVLCYAVQAFFSFSVCLVAPMFWVVLGICVRGDDADPYPA